MRVIAAEEITKNVREMCIEANVNLSEDMEKAIRDSVESEDSPLGKQILGQLCENLDIAKEYGIRELPGRCRGRSDRGIRDGRGA